MDKRMIICAITAALLGGSLVWAADHRAQDAGIAGWSTLNAGMAQALGVADEGEAGSAAAGGDGGSVVAGGSMASGAAGGEEVGRGTAGSVEVTGGGTAAGDGAVGGNVAGEAGSGVVGGVATGGGTEGAGAASAGIAGAADSGAAGSGGANGTSAATAGAAHIAAPAAADGRINVNTADIKLLMDLPGIGEKKAQAIVDYRTSKGAFRSANELGKVKGIGPKLLEKLKPLVAF
ncbi:helix-hairpin-helix domain-containing protein [Paenibacillus sp. FSL R7-0337]|uniref:ComEA family DNA-binding protein n=1 Tax=Paenibacillus sp. FSL R7-0337 TaxID=1926588 RepID=UPI00096DCC9A|nr:helix-hairpin-helix domain-containing protein [Paenibacillus sp. FSL R7-0337]OMG00263.1 hypothetical protein BK147_03375 [Paenibacillus sp. FSL R7-0337]